MTKAQFLFLIFSDIFLAMGMAEIITLSELWTDLPCKKEVILTQAKDDIQLCVQSVHITHVQCKNENNAALDLGTRVINANMYYKINNPVAGSWNCSFRSQLHARVSYCTIHIKDFDDTTSNKQIKVHEIVAWISFLALASTMVVGGIIIICYYKKKELMALTEKLNQYLNEFPVKRIETKEIPHHIGLRAPQELPSDITYDTVYCHRISWNLKPNPMEQRNPSDEKPKTPNLIQFQENAGYIQMSSSELARMDWIEQN